MIDHKVDFSALAWEVPMKGVRSKAVKHGGKKLRLVEYTPAMETHWCEKGHILLCLEGRLETELADGRKFVLTPGVSYQVADHAEPHRSSTAIGARLFIVD